MNSSLEKVTGPFLRAARIVAGIVLVIIGIVGLFLPILQGILLIVIGLACLGVDAEKSRRAWAFMRHTAQRVRKKFAGRNG